MSITTLAFAGLGAAASASWTHAVLVSLGTALALSVLGLATYLHYLRRRDRRPRPRAAPPTAHPPTPSMSARRPAAPSRARPAGGGEAVVELATSSSPAMGARLACPACRRQFDAGVRYCPYDSRRLVPAADLSGRGRVPSVVCPRCRRAYTGGLRYCPHDAEELIAATLWTTARARRPDPAPTGVLAKICPRCAGRYDLSTSVCAKDGAELMTIN